MTVKFRLDSRAVPEGTILIFGIRYTGAGPEGYARTRQQETKVYTYAMLKAGGFWYVTGGGRTPQVAGWGAVQRWLERDGRVVEWVRHVTDTAQLWPPVPSQVLVQRARDESIHDDGRPCVFIAGACNLCGATPPDIHEFEASHSGMVCGAMVQGPDGTGDQCGKPAGDPVHGEDVHPCGDFPAPCNCDDPKTHDLDEAV